MRLTQGTFSFLSDLTDEQIGRQIDYCINNAWSISVEYTDDPHPRNTYWEMHGQPMFDLLSPRDVMAAVNVCRTAHPDCYVKVSAFDASPGWESTRLSFIVQRPLHEPRFVITRQPVDGRRQRYSISAQAERHL